MADPRFDGTTCAMLSLAWLSPLAFTATTRKRTRAPLVNVFKSASLSLTVAARMKFQG